MTDDCVFCRIVKGELPSYKVHENDHAIALLDIEPLADGHIMVIPKEHCSTIEDATPEQVGGVFRLAREVSGVLRQQMGCTATTIGLNNGKDAGQAVPHLHVHVIPRTPTDQGSCIHAIVKSSTGCDLGELATKIKGSF